MKSSRVFIFRKRIKSRPLRLVLTLLFFISITFNSCGSPKAVISLGSSQPSQASLVATNTALQLSTHTNTSESATQSIAKTSNIPLRNAALNLKYSLDRLAAGVVIIVLSPLIIGVTVAIKVEGLMDPNAQGPIFRKELRVSAGEEFMIYKFRVLNQFAQKEIEPYKSRKPLEKKKENVTRVGSWILKYYLDELPQVFNIFKGEMSFVGPRPLDIDTHQRGFGQNQEALTLLRGGLTGPNQSLKGTGLMSWNHSKEYLEKCRSYGPIQLLFYDLSVIGRTIKTFFEGKGI
jgi:lipopolysaccharide/colanic/teichoic acid biosynthesis glycosyltransferase